MKHLAIITGVAACWALSLAVCHEHANRRAPRATLASSEQNPNGARAAAPATPSLTPAQLQGLVRGELERALAREPGSGAAPATPAAPGAAKSEIENGVKGQSVAAASAIIQGAMHEGRWTRQHAIELRAALTSYDSRQRALVRGQLMWAVNTGQLRADPSALVL